MPNHNLNLSEREEEIASAWSQALAEGGNLPQPTEHLRHGLVRLTRQIVNLFSDEPYREAEARSIGARLALLGTMHVDGLAELHPVLYQALTQGLDPYQVVPIVAHLGRVLIDLTTGFLEELSRDSLLEREHALQAYETEWKRFIADRQEMEQKSQAILRALPDVLSIITLDGVVLYYHAGSDQRFPNEEELPFKNIRTYMPAAVVDNLLEIYRTTVESGHPQTQEYSVTFQNGEKRDFQDHITPYLGNSVLVISRDVTRQKQIEAELRASQIRYRNVVETQNEIIGRFTTDGTITFVNLAAQRLFGLPATAMLGHNIYEFMPGIANQEFHDVAETWGLTPKKPSITDELTVVTADGVVRQLEVATQAIFNSQEKVIEYQTTGRDVTILHQMEAALRESEARFRSVVEGQTDLIIRYQLDGKITFVNDALCEFYSTSRGKLLGKSIYNMVYEIDQPIWVEFLESLKLLRFENPIQTGQVRVALAPNDIRWVEWTTRAIFGSDNLITEFQSVGRDITALKQAQAALEEQNELLMQLGEQLINVQETERQRIALDLHDSVLNELGAMLITPPEIFTPKMVRDNYQRLIDQLRETINGLRSPMLNYGLYAALEDLLDTLMDNPQAADILTMDVPPSQARFDPSVELHLFRIIQQACENALQHAQAKSIRIYGLIAENRVEITVEDDGVGFMLGQETDLAHILAQKHFGLVSMLERGKLIGAQVKLSSNPGAGTKVHVLWEPTFSWT